MNFEMLVDGQSLVKIEINVALLSRVLREATKELETDFKSTPATTAQIEELLSRIDQRSVHFLKAIAVSDEGSISWVKMRKIFGIEKDDDWAAYSGSFGKGITRAYRKILGNKIAKLVWWIDTDWEDNDWDSDMCCVYIDGPALSALRAVIGV